MRNLEEYIEKRKEVYSRVMDIQSLINQKMDELDGAIKNDESNENKNTKICEILKSLESLSGKEQQLLAEFHSIVDVYMENVEK